MWVTGGNQKVHEERIRSLRHRVGLSQRQLVETELTCSFIGMIEARKKQPSPETRRLLASRLGVTDAEIMARANSILLTAKIHQRKAT